MDKFPPKESASQVRTLQSPPSCSYIELAELNARSSYAGFEKMQRKLLAEAADMGADAVVLTGGDTLVKHGVSYQPMYSPWGYNDPYYGLDPWGYGGVGYGGLGYGTPYMAVPYDVEIKTLKGTAIRYMNGNSSDTGQPCPPHRASSAIGPS
jgi:hypothetical protein